MLLFQQTVWLIKNHDENLYCKNKNNAVAYLFYLLLQSTYKQSVMFPLNKNERQIEPT